MALTTSANPIVAPLTGRDTALADAGSFYVASNPTPGSALSGHAAATTFDETKALLYVFNGGTAPVTVYPTSLLLKLSNAGTAGTTVRFEQTISLGNRLSSGGTTLTIGGTSGQAAPSGIIATFGPAVLTAAPASRQLLGGFQYRSVIGVVLDTYGFIWGAGNADLVQLPQAVTNGTAELDMTVNYAPVSIPSGYGFAIHQWSGSQSGAYQFEPVRFEFIAK